MKNDCVTKGVLGTLLFVFTMAHATTWYVHPDSALNTIQAGLDSCVDNDTVLVAPGTYVENIVWPSRQGIHLISESGQEVTIIDGDSLGSVIMCNTSVDSSTVIRGLTITNGSGTIYAPHRAAGGGIYLSNNASLSLENVTISGNTAEPSPGISAGDGSGGGIYCNNSSPRLVNVTISGNTAAGYMLLTCGGSGAGGGISCYNNSNPHLVSVSITGNNALHRGCHGFAGGGGIDIANSSLSLVDVTISGNIASGVHEPHVCGGGINCENSILGLENVTISENIATVGFPAEGGGICSFNCSLSLTNVTISGNAAEDKGGGISCHGSNLSLTNVTISGNTSDEGGGIRCFNSSLDFDSINRCNIFLNFTASVGYDLHASDCLSINVIVDTFTVLQPDDYIAYPIENYIFDIINYKIEQVSRDLYVSPTGSNDNSGLTPDDPLLTISYALMKIMADSTNPLTIHLSNGVYAPSQTSETFPLNCRSYVSLHGEDEPSTILDGEGLSGVLFCQNDNDFSIENMTIKNGSAIRGGGIYCHMSSPSLSNITVSGNTASDYGGGIYCQEHSSPSLTNVTVSENTTGWRGGGICCLHYSNPSISNVTVSENTANNYGGGIFCNHSSPNLENVTINENTAEVYGGGIDCDWSSPSLTNVTISGNIANYGGGISCRWYSSPSLLNCVLWNDTPQEIYVASDSVTAAYSDIQGGWPGTGNIDENPVFVSGPLSDYHLCPFTPSPCIDAGNPDPQYNDPENPLVPGYAMWPALGTIRNDMGVYGGPGTEVWVNVEEYIPPQPMSTGLQILPNPFRHSTDIRYQITDDCSDIVLEVYDITGRKIKDLTTQSSVIGHLSSATWDGTDQSNRPLASGVYFVAIKAGNHRATKKVLLIR